MTGIKCVRIFNILTHFTFLNRYVILRPRERMLETVRTDIIKRSE